MLAVLEIGGSQHIVKVGDIIEIDDQNQEAGSIINTKALLISDSEGKKTKIGAPLLENSNIELKVLNNYKGEKIRVFKMHSKKRYSRTKGFRPYMTKLEIINIT